MTIRARLTSPLKVVRTLSTVKAGMPPPLKGIRVVDLTRVLAGPLASMLLGDLGADIIKIENPMRGDDTRAFPPSAPLKPDAPLEASHLPPESAYFLAVNRNRRSCTVNLKHPKGLKVLQDLIRQADVLIENYVPGKLVKMGLGYEDCKRINPRLIYTSITGYGQTGPYAKKPGYDTVIEADAGLMHITGEPTGLPNKVGVAVTDVSTGLYAHGAIMAALISRQQTGQGSWIDCNLFETQIAGLANIASNYLISGVEGTRHGTAHSSIVPYQVFPCKDGYLMIGAGNDKQFASLCENVLGLASLVHDPRFESNHLRAQHRDELVKIISDQLMKHDRDHWLDAFEGAGIPFGPINDIPKTFSHPQALARGVVTEINHPRAGPIKLSSPAVSYNNAKMPVTRPPPWLGQHTAQILIEELGYTEDKVEELRNAGVV